MEKEGSVFARDRGGVRGVAVADHRRPMAWIVSILLGCGLSIGLAEAQTYPLKIDDRAIENPYVLHVRDWPLTLGLPNAAIMRTNAGERWFQIETARGIFSPTFGNLFLPETGWVAMAEKYHTDLIYTFNTVPSWAAHQSGTGAANVAPYDIDAKAEFCMSPLAGELSPEGDCIWKEWVTALMQKDCNVRSKPEHPLVGQCQIHYFEAWNEFNAALFWQDSIKHLAKMANDMALIVRAYCGDCSVIGGSTSAGGVGRAGDGPSGSGSFETALGELLDAWHAIPNASLPDIVSFHAYPSRTNVSYPPFPETNISANDPKCTAGNVPNDSCKYAIVDQPEVVRRIMAARPYLSPALPIWNTESGWNQNKTLLHGVDAEGHADAATGRLRQAFFARETILMANKGVAVNLWYEADHQCTGTLYGFGEPDTGPNMHACPNDPVIAQGLTPAGRALVTLYGWMHGATFSGPCRSAGTVWWCPISGPAIGDAVLAWTTKWDKPESATILPARFEYAHSLDGTTAQLRSGEKPLLEIRPRLFNNVR
jgi:hypothetical protein